MRRSGGLVTDRSLEKGTATAAERGGRHTGLI